MIKKKFKNYATNLSQENFIELYETELSKRQMIDVLLTQKKKILVSNFHFFVDKPLKGTKEEIHDQLFPIFYNLQLELILEMLKEVDKKDVISFLLYFPEDQLERMMEEQISRDIDNVILKMGEVLISAKKILEKRKNEKLSLEVSNSLEIVDVDDEEEITELSHGFKMFTIYDWDSNEMSGVKNENDEIIIPDKYREIEVLSPTFIATYRINPLEETDEMGNIIENNWELWEIRENAIPRNIQFDRKIKSIIEINELENIITASDINGVEQDFDFNGEHISPSKERYDDYRRNEILKTFWTAEELNNYEITNTRKFSTWDIQLTDECREVIGYSEVLDTSMNIQQERKYYFFEDFYLSFIPSKGITIYIIGKDPDKNEFFNIQQE